MLTTPERYDKVAHHLRAHEGTARRTPADERSVRDAENRLGVSFPNSYVWFLKEFGFTAWPDYVYGLAENLPPGLNVVSVTERERSLVEPELPKYLIPFSSDGAGNHYCLDTRNLADGECPVVFWHHEFEKDQQLDRTNSSFLEWLEEQIEIASKNIS